MYIILIIIIIIIIYISILPLIIITNINVKTLSVSPMLRPIMSEASKTAKIILAILGHGSNRLLHPRPQYSTKMIFCVLDAVCRVMYLCLSVCLSLFVSTVL